MPSRTLVSVEEYLHTSYRPDCDYVDGAIVERYVGETDHSDCQGRIYAYFLNRSRQLRVLSVDGGAGAGVGRAFSHS